MPRPLHTARFYAILDTGYVSPERWVGTCRCLIEGGADLVQIRAKNSTPDQREVLLREMLPLFDKQSPDAPHLIINDDVDLCARYPGTGLHIGQDDMPPQEARRIVGSDRIIGLSTHSLEQARAALTLPEGTIDYFCVGPVFSTQTKPDYVPVGLELVRKVAALRPALPWFCIGGINRENARQVVDAGAPALVVVSDVLRAPDPAAAIRQLVADFGA